MVPANLEIPDDVGVLQAGESGHLPGDAGVLARHLPLQAYFLHGILSAVKAIDDGHCQAVRAAAQHSDLLRRDSLLLAVFCLADAIS